MSAVVALQWAKNDDVLRDYLAACPSHVFTWANHERFQNATGAMSTAGIADAVTPARRAELHAQARRCKDDVCVQVRRIAGADVAQAYDGGVEAQLGDVLLLAEALDAIHRDRGVDLVVLNEDVMHLSKAAALWAEARDVPSVSIAHSCILGRLYTVHRAMHARFGTTFGTRGAAPYLDEGVGPDRLAITGNPGWDRYRDLTARRAEVRSAVRGALQIAGDAWMIVFATTWAANLTTFCDPRAYEQSLRAFLRAGRHLQGDGANVALVVKDRPSNAAREQTVHEIVREEGVRNVQLMRDNLPELLVAADAAVSVDSNVSIEAILAGIPAVNLWTPESWYNGPFFDAQDGVFQAAPETLGHVLHAVLRDARSPAQDAVGRLAANVGAATRRTAEVLIRRRRPARTQRNAFVWQELSNPTSALDKGGTAEYYNHARHELIALLRQEPRIVLDIGCAGGATGAVLKSTYPGAVVHGVELSEEAAAIAEKRIDRVLRENVERMDFACAGFAEGSIDAVFLPDVLEHLYDPWRLLVRLRPFLAPGAQVLASVPNVRNFWLLSQLASGRWEYVEEGLLDVTHIRFFTAKSVRELFEQTGYRIVRTSANVDPRVPPMAAQQGCTADVDTPTVTLKGLTQADLDELRTLQFLVDAVPA